MSLNKYVGLGLLLALLSTSALGFQEQGAEAPVPNTARAAAVAPEAGILPGSAASAPAASGTEVRIPGLGRLGVLPKMDFGLELLYGASEPKPVEEPQLPADDLTIRGSIKHPF